MRWEAQELKVRDEAALLPLAGLVRSVRTPEFDGVTYVQERAIVADVDNKSETENESEAKKRQLVVEACEEAFAHDFISRMPYVREPSLTSK